MASVDLVFRGTPLTNPAALVFGEYEASLITATNASIDATLPALVVAVSAAPQTSLTVSATLPALVVAVTATTISTVAIDAALPALTVAVAATFIPATVNASILAALPGLGVAVTADVRDNLSIAAALPPVVVAVTLTTRYEVAILASLPALSVLVTADYDIDIPDYVTNADGVPWQEADALGLVTISEPWSQTNVVEIADGLPWHDAEFIDAATGLVWQQATRLEPNTTAFPWHQGIPLEPVQDALPWQQGTPLSKPDALPWRQGVPTTKPSSYAWSNGRINEGTERFPWQQGNEVLAYGSPLDPLPPIDLCYIPTVPADLVFDQARATDGTLLFYCELHPLPVPTTIVVPIKKVYTVINTATLTRLSDGKVMPTLSMSMSLDWQSWTWGFSATLPGSSYPDLAPDTDGNPVELVATINGISYNVIAESLSTDRTFGRKDLKIGGRGKNAILDAPYAAVQTFGADTDRTAAQLMDDVLTIGGVSIGWSIDFNLTDWLVTAGAWSHQGTYISALNAIAQAAGGYLQPHPTDQTMRVLAKYPVLPWNWLTDATADFELPAAVAAQEGIAWVEKTRYNRVFVSGQGQGSLVRVTRAGTAGDLAAPMITDPLITHSDAGLQRGGSVLGDVGREANVTLRLPVLALTGIIPPGKFVSYVDGAVTRFGIVRSVQVDVAMPQIWQSITVETHE